MISTLFRWFFEVLDHDEWVFSCKFYCMLDSPEGIVSSGLGQLQCFRQPLLLLVSIDFTEVVLVLLVPRVIDFG